MYVYDCELGGLVGRTNIWEKFTLVTNFPIQINENAWNVTKGRMIMKRKGLQLYRVSILVYFIRKCIGKK